LGDVEHAEHLVNNVLRSCGIEPDLAIFSSMLLACKNDRNAARGEFWLLEAERAGVHLDGKSYNIAAQLFANAGMLQQAEKLLIDMETVGHPPDPQTISAVALILVRTDKVDSSMELLGRMADRGTYASTAVHNAVLYRLATTGQICRASKWFHDLMKKLMAAPYNGFYQNVFLDHAVVNDITACFKGVKIMIDEGRHHPTEDVIKKILRPFAGVAEAEGESESSNACNRQAVIFSVILATLIKTYPETLK